MTDEPIDPRELGALWLEYEYVRAAGLGAAAAELAEVGLPSSSIEALDAHEAAWDRATDTPSGTPGETQETGDVDRNRHRSMSWSEVMTHG